MVQQLAGLLEARFGPALHTANIADSVELEPNNGYPQVVIRIAQATHLPPTTDPNEARGRIRLRIPIDCMGLETAVTDAEVDERRKLLAEMARNVLYNQTEQELLAYLVMTGKVTRGTPPREVPHGTLRRYLLTRKESP